MPRGIPPAWVWHAAATLQDAQRGLQRHVDSLDGGNGTDYLNVGVDTDTCTLGTATTGCENETRRP